jgi:heme/copper-type cytochrome/quinol oxidase subunit 3
MAVFTMILLAGLPAAAGAGQAKPAPTRAAESAPAQAQAPPAVDERTARDTRERLREIFEQYPPSVAQVLRLDPSLLTRPDYLSLYPTLATYLAQHPEVAHNPVFFLGGPFNGQQYSENRSQAANAVENIFIGFEVLLGVMTFILTLGWLIKAAIEHRRWLRATKIQTDAHSKIVDRLSSNEDLLAYMQSPTGQRFLTASLGVPSAADVAPPTMVGAPFNRILWSVQAGVVLAAAGFGLWIAKNGVIEEVAQPLQVISILAIALGIGFVASAFASYALSRQLGLVQSHVPHA